MAKIANSTVVEKYKVMLGELVLTQKEKAAQSAAHKENLENARQIVSNAIIETKGLEERNGLINKLREYEKVFREQNPTFKIKDPLTSHCCTVDPETKKAVPFQGQSWWKQYELPSDKKAKKAKDGSK